MLTFVVVLLFSLACAMDLGPDFSPAERFLSRIETTLHTKVFLGKTDEALEILQQNGDHLPALLDCTTSIRCPLETALLRGHLDLACKLIEIMRDLQPDKSLKDILLRWNNPMLFEAMWRENKVGTKIILEILAEEEPSKRYQDVRYYGQTAMDYAKSLRMYEMQRFLVDEMKWNQYDDANVVEAIVITPSDSASSSPGKPRKRKVSLSPRRTFEIKTKKNRRRSMSSPVLGGNAGSGESIAARLQKQLSAEEAITGNGPSLAESRLEEEENRLGSSGTDTEDSPRQRPEVELRKRKPSPRAFTSLPNILHLRRSDSDSSKKKSARSHSSLAGSDGDSGSPSTKGSPRHLDSPSGSPRTRDERKASPREELLKKPSPREEVLRKNSGEAVKRASSPRHLAPEPVDKPDSEHVKRKSSPRIRRADELPK